MVKSSYLPSLEPDIWRPRKKSSLHRRLEHALFHLPKLPWRADTVSSVQRLSRITMICGDPDRLADFYEAAFGFVRTGEASTTEPAFGKLIGIPNATARIVFCNLANKRLNSPAISPSGRSYPHGVSGRSPLFQHFAIVVSDMATAYARLSECEGWKPISTDGPQLLPASSGGATAYKFRDPDGHPLELIAFARDAIPVKWQETSAAGCLGIDHSAISIADTRTKRHVLRATRTAAHRRLT